MNKRISAVCAALVLIPVLSLPAEEPPSPDYRKQIAPIFRKYCAGCHNKEDAEGELVLDSFTTMLKGGANGKIVVPGKAEKSRLILVLEKKAEPFMPPEDNEATTAKEIQLLKAWINAGAKGPVGPDDPHLLITPEIKPVGNVRRPISAVDHSPNGRWVAVARYGTVEILSAGDLQPVTTLSGHSGNVNDVHFSRDSRSLCVAAGEAALFGEATLWDTTQWKRTRAIKGHNDSLYAAQLSPDGSILATTGYDQKILLWETANGKLLRELTGHNGPVFDLAFHPDGEILASASGDRTVKLWSVTDGKRLETLNQPEKEQYATAFSPDGKYVIAGGVDNRIRVWDIRQVRKEGTNPLLYSRYAHEASILELEFSPDGKTLVSSGEDHTVKFWDTKEFRPRFVLKEQPDWVSALSVTHDGESVLAGRMDGSLTSYDSKSGRENAGREARPVTSLPVPESHEAVAVAELPKGGEIEPNDTPQQAMPMPAPATVQGLLWKGLEAADGAVTPDVDLYRFQSKKGQTWVIETDAARKKSPADTRIEVLHPDGTPVLQYLLRAVRDSSITFRPINSTQDQARVTNWREMDLNQFLYMGGEICKLYRMPEGPDSGFQFYTISGKRRCYFDTSATVHALDDPVYIVEPYLPGTRLTDNGLPVFNLYYTNDDDGDRKLGNDSRLMFTAPEEGEYLVRVTDVRGFNGDKFQYMLTVREPKPDFNVTLAGKNATIGAGGGQRLVVRVDRIDGFDGDVRVDITGMPDGLNVSTPIVIQAGHLEAQGVINADLDARPTLAAKNTGSKKTEQGPAPPPLPEPLYLLNWSKLKITATASIGGKQVVKPVGDLGNVNIADKPNVIVHLEPDPEAKPVGGQSDELVIAPGTSITAMLRIERNGFNGEIRFDVDNLPHGVIVDNLGLNGIMVREGETHRRIFITASDWVPETTRLIHATGRGAGNQASRPIVLHVRNPKLQAGR